MENKDLTEQFHIREGSFAEYCGMRIEEVAPGECVLALDIQPFHSNPEGLCHGGMIFTLMDSAAGAASRSVRKDMEHCRQVTQSASVYYLAPAREGTIRARATVIRAGRTTGLVQVDVTDDAGRHIARGEVSVYYLDA